MTTLTGIHANLKAGRYDYSRTWAKRRRAAFLTFMANRALPAFITLVEAEAPACASLAATFGMKCESYRGSAVLWNPAKLKLTRPLRQVPWLAAPQTQSLLFCELKVIATGEVFNLGVSHLPPFANRAALRRADMGVIDAMVDRWSDPTILCTDANWTKTLEPFMKARGWASARLTAPTKINANYRTSSALPALQFKPGNPIDYALLRHGAKAALYGVRDGRKFSDHNVIELAVTL